MKQRWCEGIGHALEISTLVLEFDFNDTPRKNLNRVFPNSILKLVRELGELSKGIEAPACHYVDGDEVSTGLRVVLGFVLGSEFAFGHGCSRKWSRSWCTVCLQEE